MNPIYSFEFLKALFNEMAGSYERVNYITSFGFSIRFRRQFVERAEIEPGHAVCDLMCGRGECWPFILDHVGTRGSLVGLDLSTGMLKGAHQRRAHYPAFDVQVLEGNALATGFADQSFDRVVMAFGLKTLDPALRRALADEVFRLLRPGGVFSTVEISEPVGWFLRGLYMWYLKRIIPVLGRLFLGNPDNYRMLAVYVERFDGCRAVAEVLREAGFEAEAVPYFHGCATGIVARRPASSA